MFKIRRYTRATSNGVKVMSLGDLHKAFVRHGQYYDEFVAEVCNVVCMEKPDLLLVLGDLLEGHKDWFGRPYLYMVRFIRALSLYCPVVVILGNHDLHGVSLDGIKERFLELDKISNVFPLMDGATMITCRNGKKVAVTSRALEASYYSTVWNRWVAAIKGYDLAAVVADKVNTACPIMEADVNILALHECKTEVLHSDKFNNLSMFDAIYGAHMHSGYMPESLIDWAKDRKWNLAADPTRGVYTSRNLFMVNGKSYERTKAGIHETDKRGNYFIVFDESISRMNIPPHMFGGLIGRIWPPTATVVTY